MDSNEQLSCAGGFILMKHEIFKVKQLLAALISKLTLLSVFSYNLHALLACNICDLSELVLLSSGEH